MNINDLLLKMAEEQDMTYDELKESILKTCVLFLMSENDQIIDTKSKKYTVSLRVEEKKQ